MDGLTIQKIAAALDAEAVGDLGFRVTGAAEPADAGPRDLALAMHPKYAAGLTEGRARAALVWADADWQALGLAAAIRIGRPRLAMAGVTQLLDPGPGIEPGIHPSAVIHPSAAIGPDAAIGPFVSIGQNVVIGPNARIASHVSIADGARIGADALIHSGARIGARVEIGDRFVAQPNCVIGADGFSFVTPAESHVETARKTLGAEMGDASQSWRRIHSLGTVVIGDDVEIGAVSTIDRGTIRATRIGDGTKIDNMVHIGHNCIVGRDCLLCGQVGIAGSVDIGDNVVLGGQTGVVDNIFIGDGVVTGGGTVVMSNVPAGRMMVGYPAVKMESHVESYKGLRRLPRLFRQVADLQKAVSKAGRDD